MNRRQLVTLMGGAAAWPLAVVAANRFMTGPHSVPPAFATPIVAAAAQPADRIRRVGALMGWSDNDPDYRSDFAVLVQALAQLGWVEGRTLALDVRWTNGDVDRARQLAKELVESQPDVIIAGTTPSTAALLRDNRTIPTVFTVVSDPVGAGFVDSLARPGGNFTGFIDIEAGMGGKWPELLKDLAPGLMRLAIMFNPDTAPGGGSYFLGPFAAAARLLAVEPIVAPVRGDEDIERAIASLGAQAGLVVMSDSFMSVHRGTIISVAARHHVPAIYGSATFTREGGLISYGPNYPDMFRRTALYVDRILRGAKAADLPVQVPTQFELEINLKTARALGLTVPVILQATADELIE